MINNVGVAKRPVYPDISWKMVTKGKRSRKPNARNFNKDAKLVNSSPKRVADFSCSESDKVGEAISSEQVSNKVEHIPIKKRRHLLEPSSPSRVPSDCGKEEPLSSESLPAPTQSEEQVVGSLNQCNGVAASKFLNDIKEEEVDVKFTEVTNGKGSNARDLSGIELLAAAACNDNIDSHSGCVEGGSGIKAEENMLPDTKFESALKKSPVTPQDPCVMSENVELTTSLSPKISRLHWDLNTTMDSWELPYDDPIRDNISDNVICSEMPKEEAEIDIRGEHMDSDICLDNSEKCMPLTQEHPSVPPSVSETVATSSSLTVTCEKISFMGTSSECLDLSPPKPSEGEGLPVIGEVCGNEDRVSTSMTTIDDSPMELEPKGLIERCVENCTSNEGDKSCYNELQTDYPVSPSMKISVEPSHEDGRDSVVPLENHDQPIGSVDVSRFQAGNRSPVEDGELRGSVLYPWEENEDDFEMECVDYETDGDYNSGSVVEAGSASKHLGTDNKSLSPTTQPKQSLIADSDKTDIGGKEGSDAGSGTTTQQRAEMSLEGNIGVRNKWHSTDHIDGYGFRQAFEEETSSWNNKSRYQSHIEKPLHLHQANRNDASLLNRSPRDRCGSYTRPRRDFSSERYAGRYRSPRDTRNRNELNCSWEYRDSTNHHPQIYRRNESRGRGTWRRNFARSSNEFVGTNPRDFQHSVNYSSNVPERSSFRRRSPVDRDYFVEVPQRALQVRGGGVSRRYPQQQYHPSSRKRSISPVLGRRSHSRSRTRSPHAWHSQRDGIPRTRPNRSPDSRPRIRAPFQQARGRGFVSPNRNHFSPRRNSRWPGDHDSMGNHFRHQRTQRFDGVETDHDSMGNHFRNQRTQRFDGVEDHDSMGNHFRHQRTQRFDGVETGLRPARFPRVDSCERGFKLEEDRSYRRLDDRNETMVQQMRHSDGDKFSTPDKSQTGEELLSADQKTALQADC